MQNRTLEFSVCLLPPQECSPNARVHWARRYKAAKSFQAAVQITAVDVRNRYEQQGWSFPFGRTSASFIFVAAQSRSRDTDNWLARMKPGIDALVHAGILAGDDTDHLVIKSLEFKVDKYRSPLTIIRLREL